MNLLTEAFYQLPFCFDPQPILEELSQISKTEWQDNPQGFFGIESLILVSNQGRDTHFTYGEMKPCARLERLPRTRRLLSIFDAPLGATRIMRLAPNAKVSTHVDLHYYWKHRFRIHLVLQTHPDAIFGCRNQVQHLPAGQVWISDSWSLHFVENNSAVDRIHIVIDTIGSEKIWKWLEASWHSSLTIPPKTILPQENFPALPLHFETHGDSLIKHPAQTLEIIQDILADYEKPEDVKHVLYRLERGWREIYAKWGQTSIFPYQQFLAKMIAKLETASPQNPLSNQVSIPELLQIQLGIPIENLPLQIKRPIFILSAPRSGQVRLQQLLSSHPSLWTLPHSVDLFEHISSLHPEQQGYQDVSILDSAINSTIEKQIFHFLKQKLQHSRYSSHFEHPDPLKEISFLDCSPKNAFRISAILKLFPDARFIYLHQHPIKNLQILMDGWRAGQSIPYLDLPNWHHQYPWSFTLVPNWRSLCSKSLGEVCFAQYKACHEHIIEALRELPRGKLFLLDIDKMEQDSNKELRKLFRFLHLPLPQQLPQMKLELPVAKNQIQNAIDLQDLFVEINQFYQEKIVTFTQK